MKEEMKEMEPFIRNAQIADIPALVELSEQKRTEYQQYQPTFWRKAKNSRQKQQEFFTHLLSKKQTLILVCEQEKVIQGFVIASLVTAPPVYDPRGLICSIDDFCLASNQEWESIGRSLLEKATDEAKQRGAVLSVVVCGHLDQPKREMLAHTGFTIASEWYVRDL